MNIVMMTNTYLPHVGGVANSVHRFTTSLRSRGHNVLVAAPNFEGVPENEENVIRLPAVQKFNGSDFSVTLPAPGYLTSAITAFGPHIFHSHHPFLIGDTALRKAASRNLPIVFTHHTLYEEYVHYVPVEAENLKEFVKELSTGYANLCNHIVAPSESIKEILLDRGVTTPISVVPTGVDTAVFARGDRDGFRKQVGLPQDAFVVGHVGRLAPEKNLEFLTEAVSAFLRQKPGTWFLVVGSGPSQETMQEIVTKNGVAERTVFAGRQTGQDLVDSYHASDVFAFSSKSETQGMVLVEAMAANNPVVGLEASGVREVVRDQRNGRLIRKEEIDAFVEGLSWVADQDTEQRQALIKEARVTAEDFSLDACAAKIERVYEDTVHAYARKEAQEYGDWTALLGRVAKEWDLWSNRLNAARVALLETPAPGPSEEATT